MRIALPIWDSRVSPVFDVAQSVLVVEVEADGKRSLERWSLTQTDPAARAQSLVDWGVAVLICGAISQTLERLLKGHGVAIISCVRGEADAVLDAYLGGRLDEPRFAMPGCDVVVDSGGTAVGQPLWTGHCPAGVSTVGQRNRQEQEGFQQESQARTRFRPSKPH